MDNFMMQLTDRINAQDMIRANTSAEVEELGRVKGQIEALQATVDQAKEMMERLAEITQQNLALAQENAKENAKEAEIEAVKEISGETLPEAEQPKLDEDILYIIEEEVSQLSKKLEDRNVTPGLEEIKDRLAALERMTAEVTEQVTRSVQTALEQNDQEDFDAFDEEEAIGQLQELMNQLREEYGAQREDQGRLREQMDQLRGEFGDQKQELVEKEMQNQEQLLKNVKQLLEEYGAQKEDQGKLQELMDQLLEEYCAQKEDQGKLQELMDQLLEEYGAQREDQGRLRELMDQLREENGEQKQELVEKQAQNQEQLLKTMKQLLEEYASEQREQQNASLDQAELFNDMKLELSRLDEHLTNVGASATTKNTENAESLKRFLQERFDRLQEASKKDEEEKEDGDEVQKLLEDLIAQLSEKDAKLEDRLTKMHEGLRDGYHKECVKVYRNVQAAFSEENQRQSAVLEEKMGKSSGSSKVAMIFSILAFLMSLASVVLQVLKML